MSGFSCSKSNCKLSNFKNASARKYLRFSDLREELIQLLVFIILIVVQLYVDLYCCLFVCLFFVACDISRPLGINPLPAD